MKLAGLAPATQLAVLARKLTCQVCRGRGARVFLGTYITGAASQPWADWRRIAFEGDRVVRPVRVLARAGSSAHVAGVLRRSRPARPPP